MSTVNDDVVEANATATSFCFVTDEDLCGRNIQLLTSFLLLELLGYPRETVNYNAFFPMFFLLFLT